MSDEWNSYPQTDLPTGVVAQTFNPYQRRDEQILMATRFLDDAPGGPALILVQLDVPDATVRCAQFDAMQRLVCQNYTAYVVGAATVHGEMWIPSCAAHLARACQWGSAIGQKRLAEDGPQKDGDAS